MLDPRRFTDEELAEVLYSMDGEANPERYAAVQAEFSRRFPDAKVPSAEEARNIRYSDEFDAIGSIRGWIASAIAIIGVLAAIWKYLMK